MYLEAQESHSGMQMLFVIVQEKIIQENLANSVSYLINDFFKKNEFLLHYIKWMILLRKISLTKNHWINCNSLVIFHRQKKSVEEGATT